MLVQLAECSGKCQNISAEHMKRRKLWFPIGRPIYGKILGQLCPDLSSTVSCTNQKDFFSFDGNRAFVIVAVDIRDRQVRYPFRKRRFFAKTSGMDDLFD